MAAAGRLFSEPPGTSVRIVAPRPESAVRVGGSAFYPVEVEVLEGPRKGRHGLVSHRYLTPLAGRAVPAGVEAPAGARRPTAMRGPGRGPRRPPPPPDSLQAGQRRYEEETRQRQQNDQAMQETLNRIRRAQEAQLQDASTQQRSNNASRTTRTA